jgi:hypothetical protein
MNARTYLLYGVVLLTGIVRSQEMPVPAGSEVALDSLQRTRQVSIALERNINTFNWFGGASVDTLFGSTRITLAERYVSNVILREKGSAATGPQLQSNQQNISLLLSHPASKVINAQAFWSSLVYSDNKAVGLNNASSHSVLGGVEYVPSPIISLNPMLGYRWDNQPGGDDRGLTYNIGARTRTPLVVDGYSIAGSAQFHEDRLNPRVLESHFAQLGAQKTFLGNTRDSLEAGFRRTRREFYTLSSNDIESRIEDAFFISNLLDYEVTDRFLTSLYVSINGRVLNKDVRYMAARPVNAFDTRIEELRLDGYLQASYRESENGFAMSARMGYGERDETHSAKPLEGIPLSQQPLFDSQNKLEKRKDNLSRRTSVAGTAEIPVSLSDRVFVSGAASVLRYDTPSEENVEDRDELLVAVTIATTHRISQYLELGIGLDGNLSHTVYLFKDRSANNNYNRILRLSPRVLYRPFKQVVSQNMFEVLANYTVYDFEQQAAQVRSFSYRQFSWVDSTSVELTGRIGLDFFAYLKLYERGQLRWSEFRERTENSFADNTYAFQVRFSPHARTLFAVGIRYFSQSRYLYEGSVRKLDTVFRSIGPTCAILWDLNSFGQITLKGWYERRTQTKGDSRSLANMSMNIFVNF